MIPGFDKPHYVPPFNHRGSFETNMFGWDAVLTPEPLREELAGVRPSKCQELHIIPDYHFGTQKPAHQNVRFPAVDRRSGEVTPLKTRPRNVRGEP